MREVLVCKQNYFSLQFFAAGMGNLEVFKQVCKGYVMPISLLPRCPEKLYNIMQMCWEFKPVKRPTFKILLSLLEKFYDEEHGYEDIGA